MSAKPIPQGHLGNLTADQEKGLKEIWNTFYSLDEKGADALKASSGKDEGSGAGAISASEKAETLKLIKEEGYEKIHAAFWGAVKAEHPDALMLRFLRARKWDVKAAFAMLTCMLKWRIELDVDSITARGEEDYNKNLPGFDLQMKSGKAYLHGADKETRPVFYIHVQIHRTNQQTFEALRTFTIYSMETGRLFLAPPTNQCCLVFDLTNFGLKNMDWPFVQFLVKAFEAYYPETLGTLIIHKAPWVFSGIWKVLAPLLDPVVRQKVQFTRNDKDLLEFIDANQLPKGLGGNEDWTWEYTDVVEGEGYRNKDEKARTEWTEKRHALCNTLEEKTRVWMGTEDEKIKLERDNAIVEYRIASLEADPYLRPRTVYHRHNNLHEDGTVEWAYKSDAGDQKFGTSLNDLKKTLEDGQAKLSATTNGTSEKPAAVSVKAGTDLSEKTPQVEHVETAPVVSATA